MKRIKQFEQYGMNNSHKRVIPRDFFNEAKLLKCMGMLALSVLDSQTPDGIDIEVEERGEPFNISMDEGWNIFTVTNYPVYVNGEQYVVGTTINSKEPFPFYLIDEEEYVEVLIFDNNGKYSDEFIEHFQNKED